ncbi:hypothetical protein MIMGU_mgv1a023955mg [Erythranthe guttata]|uniref:Galectin domain-containing protein n=1 Tax=Erythranthe guttata TaxID=4155 RepID=A0A022QQI2_ERYGU|nr:hypothetical protein MIMGU_mgv1a023955mg [Erythranthe guttata]
MKKYWYYRGVLTTFFLMLFLLGYFVITKNPNINEQTYFTNPEKKNTSIITSQVININISINAASDYLFSPRNFSKEEQKSLQTWSRLKHLATSDLGGGHGLPNAAEAIKEAAAAWENLMSDGNLATKGGSYDDHQKLKRSYCPRFVANTKTNASQYLVDGGSDGLFELAIPCGLTRGSSITFIGIPNGGDFHVKLTGERLPEEPNPHIILHYNIRSRGHVDSGTNTTDDVDGDVDPVIVQNTWSILRGWGDEDRCPPYTELIEKVDEVEHCNTNISMVDDGKWRENFPFMQKELFVATIRVGLEGIHMEVDGKHATSFRFRETMEPFLVKEVRISGDVNLISFVASGLPTTSPEDDLENRNNDDVEALKAVPILPPRKRQQIDLLIGIFSTSNNFRRRMAVRRSWMQYPLIRSGHVVVRFFVGLHKNQSVNEELWNEARTYEDIQLMPFVDYYTLITWKTIAICIFGTEVVPARFIMKTDDDAFVRVDEMLTSLKRTNKTRGLLYGLIDSDTKPDRNRESKWYISPEEWAEDKYPPWAHGPGYVVSNDIARTVSKKHRKGRLKSFKLEDVAMGIWIEEMTKKNGLEVTYKNDEKIFNCGCEDGYVVAHYQRPPDLLCLWQKIQHTKLPTCCGS